MGSPELSTLRDSQMHSSSFSSSSSSQGLKVAQLGPTSEKATLLISPGKNTHGSGFIGERFKARYSIILLACVSVLLVLKHGLHYLPRDKLIIASSSTSLVHDAAASAATTNTTTTTALAGAVLKVFQVYLPIWAPSGATEEATSSHDVAATSATSPTSSSCQVLLMEHSFGFSYGQPFIRNYTPPACKFNRVTVNFTVTSQGRQFDRLAIMYFNDTEIWRTSTAEPTINGIRWEYTKDMSEYMYFWTSPQKLIFDLGNLINDVYTGSFNTTLTATLSTVLQPEEPATLILPISARKAASDAASAFLLPSDNASNTISFPRNANRAIFSVSACGQAAEEFWWGNVLESNTNTFEPVAGTLYGYSPFREVQVLIDGQLAGVQWPHPVIFTGGVVPGLWRPIVGIDAFDLREHEIDITPWLPILCDGKQHTFRIKVVGIVDDGKTSGTLTESVGNSWFVTGKIFIWLDEDDSITIGRAPTILLPAPVISVSQNLTQNATGTNTTLSYHTKVQRTLSVSSLLTTQAGTRLQTWTQNLAVTNYGLFTSFGSVQTTNQITSGIDESTGGIYYKSSYKYPLYANTSFLSQPGGNFTIDADLILGLHVKVQGKSVFPSIIHSPPKLDVHGTSLSTTQNGTAHYFGSPSARVSSGWGSTSQVYSFSTFDQNKKDSELYYRSVEAANGKVERDHETSTGFGVARCTKLECVDTMDAIDGVQEIRVRSVKSIIGRGPGEATEISV